MNGPVSLFDDMLRFLPLFMGMGLTVLQLPSTLLLRLMGLVNFTGQLGDSGVACTQFVGISDSVSLVMMDRAFP